MAEKPHVVILGAGFGGIGAGPGALVGATVGIAIGAPAAVAAEYATQLWYTSLDERQQAKLDRFVYAHYGVN